MEEKYTLMHRMQLASLCITSMSEEEKEQNRTNSNSFLKQEEDAIAFTEKWTNVEKHNYLATLFPDDQKDLEEWLEQIPLDKAFCMIYSLFGPVDFF